TLWTAEAIQILTRPPDGRRFLLLLAWQALALLARTQAVVLVPFSLLLGALVGSRQRRALQVAGVVAGVAAVGLAQGAYHWAANGTFGPVRSSGIQLLTSVAYVLREGDVSRVPPGEDRRFVEGLYRRLHEGHLLAWQNAPSGIPRSHHFGKVYNEICWNAVGPQYAEVFLHRPVSGGVDGMLRQMSPDEWRQLDAGTRRIALELLPAAGGRYAENVVRCVYETQKLNLLIVAVMLGVGASLLTTSRGVGGSLLLLAGAWCANTLLVAMVEYPMSKYTFYFDVPVCVAVAAALLALRHARLPGIEGRLEDGPG
ncbi:MAG TPA: hypothetical protein VJ739_18730, partial [Gemmataceae bacterium]|nr:hypothetical protein [Gemmataceae bacterium]